MSRTRSIALCLCSLTLFFCSPALASQPTPWLEIHSPHFTVITDAGDKKGREIAFRFEQMRSVFAGLLGKDRLSQSIPLTILALKNDKDYYQCAPLRNGQPITAAGFFLPGEDQDFIVLNAFEPEPWRAVAHDFAYMLLTYNYPPAQGWFDEGLAEYFSSIHLDDKQVEIGGDAELLPSMTEDLLGNQHQATPSKSLTELLAAQVWLPLPDLFAMKHDPSTRNEGTHHVLYYAESWIVMHYLLHDKLLPDTGQYFNLVLNQHVPVEEAIVRTYGMSSAQLEAAVKTYFQSLPALQSALDAARNTNVDPSHPNTAAMSQQVDHFPTPVRPDDSVITANPLPESDALAIYGDVQVRIPERREAGLKTLHDLATTPTPSDLKIAARQEQKMEQKKKEAKPGEEPDLLPADATGNEIAHRVLAWDHIQQSEFDDAFNELSDAASLNRNDMWLRYYFSVARHRVAQSKHAQTQGLSNMMIDLKAVLDWYPEFADAYDLLAVARNEGGTVTAALQAARAAISLSPRNDRYVYHLAQIYISNKNFDGAQALLDRLTGRGSQYATPLKDELALAGAQHKYGVPVNTAVQAKLEPQKTPFDVLDEDASKREAAAAQNAQPNGADMRPTKFLKGVLVDIDCSQSPAAILTVSAQGMEKKFRAGDYKSLLLIGADDFSCEWHGRQVTVNYKPGGLADGDLVSLEMR